MRLRGALLLLGLGLPARGEMLLPSRAPMGFNSFDSYPADALNDTSVEALAELMQGELLCQACVVSLAGKIRSERKRAAASKRPTDRPTGPNGRPT